MTKKKVSLASALSSSAKNIPVPAYRPEPERERATAPAKATVTEIASKQSLPPSRQGKKAITGYFIPEVQRQLKIIALDEETTVQELLNEALNDLFLKKGKSPII